MVLKMNAISTDCFFSPESSFLASPIREPIDTLLKKYRGLENDSLLLDIYRIFNLTIKSKLLSEPSMLITVGAPCSGKTTLMNILLLGKKYEEGKFYGVVDPDAILTSMENTYHKSIEICLKKQKGLLSLQEQQKMRIKVYKKWIGAAHAIGLIVLGKMVEKHFAFSYSATLSEDLTKTLFSWVKSQNYRIDVIHLTTPLFLRVQHFQERFSVLMGNDLSFRDVEVPEFVKEDGEQFHRAIFTYFAYGDSIAFYLCNDPNRPWRVALWEREKGLRVIHRSVYRSMFEEHDSVCGPIGGPLWGEVLVKQNLL